MKFKPFWIGSAALVVMTLLSTQTAMAEAANATAADEGKLEEIVVTAQKREENINTVPMSITAATADQLRDAGVTQVRDLVKITPGLTYADSGVGTPIYTIRGVGFSDIALAGRPTVSVYSDQAPLPFSIEARGANFDLERVEVLKGPQGTLFGTNSTGGAINFIAAKPTNDFEAGADVSYGRFNSNQVSAFVSGPIAGALNARIAIEHDGMDSWQRSYTTSAKNGALDFWNGRLILDWAPADRFKASFTLSGWIDHSDTQPQQFIAYVPTTPAPVPELQNYPVAPHDDRAADFDLGRDYRKDNDFLQTNLRLDFTVADGITLTSLTSYSRYHEKQLDDLDGTTISNNYYQTLGRLRSISQELRLAGSFLDRGRFTIGGNYVDDQTGEFNPTFSPVSSVSNLFSSLFGTPLPVTFDTDTNQDSITKAAFASLDYNLTDAFSVYAGARYTDFRTKFSGCASDSGDGVAATIFSVLDGTPVAPGGCFTVTESGLPGIVKSTLQEPNTSWRAGAQWTVDPQIIFYGNVSRGYKAGSFPIVPANSYLSFNPVTQESVLASEVGFKAGLFDRTLRINGAIFHYDYTNKQVLGSVALPGVGNVLRLLNIPKSRVNGAELDIAAMPVSGLKISAAGTFISTRVASSFLNITPFGTTVDFKGESFPNTPKWQLSSDVEYKWPVSDRLKAFLGGNVSYQSSSYSQFGELPLFNTRAYALLDLRAGVETEDGKWRAALWGRNVADTYYWSAATYVQDAVVRYMGMPATYGLSISYRYR
jgi:outer membrane receptor protein involved in Fe transport